MGQPYQARNLLVAAVAAQDWSDYLVQKTLFAQYGFAAAVALVLRHRVKKAAQKGQGSRSVGRMVECPNPWCAVHVSSAQRHDERMYYCCTCILVFTGAQLHSNNTRPSYAFAAAVVSVLRHRVKKTAHRGLEGKGSSRMVSFPYSVCV